MTKPKFHKTVFKVPMYHSHTRQLINHKSCDGWVCGEFAIHSEGRGRWVVTYLPLGCSLGNDYSSQAQARAMVKGLIDGRFHDIQQINEPDARLLALQVRKRVKGW